MAMTEQNKMRKKMANTIRFLAADMVQQANSGHPGAPMGLADIAVVLSEKLSHNPKNPKWLNRDRLVFSGGHGSALIYSLLHLWGYDVSLEDLKQFRQLDSKTPGHPEYGHTAGVEMTTGPLGQGIANAVGFAMAEAYTANQVNSETCALIDHKVYCLCGDGDLQEGISYEACALAGHLKLKDLVLIYDSNCITIEGDTSIAWSEDVAARFRAQNWDVKEVNGHCYDEIERVLDEVNSATKPTIIIANTIIGKGAGELEGTHHTHGAPLGAAIIAESKEKEGFDPEAFFQIPQDVLLRFRCALELGELAEKEWIHRQKEAPLVEQNVALERLLNPDFSAIEYPDFSNDASVATRDSNGKILNAIAKAVPSFLGGSADLAPSNKTELKEMGNFPKGKNMHFGIREHSMAAITNAMALYGTTIPFNATFFVFSDYLKPAARIAALTHIQNFFIWTHDSIGVGEDGPTHEPIEHLSQFRALPNFYVWRPADATENVEAWKTALQIQAPHAFVLSRQSLKTLKPKRDFGEVSKGAYIVKKRDNANLTLMASGSELMPCLKAACYLAVLGIKANVVSVPCLDLFNEQDATYKNTVIDQGTKVLAVEAATATEYYRYADDVLGMESFGASAPAELLFEKFGFTQEGIMKRACKLMDVEYREVELGECKL
ncbi:MAG TPA: transketolase [Sulfurovum sp.]|jgi:transketolase|nr:MAG: transketolase [Sulfurovum sp. 35-42-20]OYY55977.1 MAG: transketolase [Sulfurovum sp. 28-43-6]OYZ26332.1 MAG: transketolase [Sulfurovum sp. 16-42-52]OYZ48806.1 MAG: transketolase [Sulfurovum sp. 24-42-9]OZA46490.1 MAG: transketolase [Sulfurovum sp. 17-42-90]OZA59090.1 MAG: transketolase [Sulfurovum sp. 39-42-12]HQR74253.1 transketolase [Sulfurovum sp.]